MGDDWVLPSAPPSPSCEPGCPGCNPWPVRLLRRAYVRRAPDGTLRLAEDWDVDPVNPRDTRVPYRLLRSGQLVRVDASLPGGAVAFIYPVLTRDVLCWLAPRDELAAAVLVLRRPAWNRGAPVALLPLPDGGFNLVVDTSYVRALAARPGVDAPPGS